MGKGDAVTPKKAEGGVLLGPVLAVCGWSGAGKTTLLEAVIPTLVEGGLRVAVIKNDVHGIDVDRPGKDSDRLFRAGADVVLRGPGEEVLRTHRSDGEDFVGAVRALQRDHDLVLVEGHRSAPVDKVWLASDDDPRPPAEIGRVLAVMGRDENRPRRLLDLVSSWLPEALASLPLRAGVLIGGSSTRMGRPKHLLARGGATLLERTVETVAGRVAEVVLLGGGPLPDSCRALPRLPDCRDAEGPLAGMLAAHRWAPGGAWLFCPCDLPDLSAEAIEWLSAQRAPGRWAVLPRTAGGLEPLLAVYELQAAPLLEALAARGERAPRLIASHAKVVAAMVPAGLARAWQGVNTPTDLAGRELSGRS